MASLVEDAQGNYLVAFRFGGKQFKRSLDTRDRRIADTAVARVDETLMRIRRGWLTLPEGAEPGLFVVSGGALTSQPVAESATARPATQTLESVFALYAGSLTPGSKEANSLATEQIHKKHLFRILGEEKEFAGLDLAAVQIFVDARSKEGRKPDTIRKELATLRMVWNWAFKRGHVPAPAGWSMSDLTFSKGRQKPPFMTWEQIERRISAGKLSAAQKAELWECLYLDEGRIKECLSYVQANARYPFVYPLIAFAAFTGARRSELVRAEREDFDFAHSVVAIRQKKSDSSKDFTIRHVPLHPTLVGIMRDWFATHPGGRHAIVVDRDEGLTPRMATKYLRGVLAGSKWSVLHGFHVFRHSLASIMASKGKDARLINAILGHSTEDMERRYRHLFPATQEKAIGDLFQ